ncbi:hypothetical protein JKG47_20830 [Acidithiobacillus sp. MC6.1]|nr:hypothetical protein [Acidithiobacillus sp. MC6.1]
MPATSVAKAHQGQIIQCILTDQGKFWLPLEPHEREHLCNALGWATPAMEWLRRQATELTGLTGVEMVRYLWACVREHNRW